MGKRKVRSSSRYVQRLNRAARWTDRAMGWYRDLMDGWEKFCSGAVKLCLCAVIGGMLWKPSYTVGVLQQHGSVLHSIVASSSSTEAAD